MDCCLGELKRPQYWPSYITISSATIVGVGGSAYPITLETAKAKPILAVDTAWDP